MERLDDPTDLIDNAAWLAGYRAFENDEPCPWGDESARLGRIAAKWDADNPEPHCQLCGNPAVSHDTDAYTECCNELLCYGHIGPEACTGCRNARRDPIRED